MAFTPLATGIHLEGLALDGDTLWYSDVMAGGIHRLNPDGSLSRWREKDLCIGGILINADGKVLSTGEGGIFWLDPAAGNSGVLIDRVEGAPIPGVNEMAVDANGGIAFGVLDIPAFQEDRQPGPSALYHLNISGEITQLSSGLKFSNGLAYSPDFRRLYHNESFVGTVAYELDDNNQVIDSRLLLDKPDCDGIKVDRQGRIWISGFSSNELVIINGSGDIIEVMPLPGEASTNLIFGGSDGKDLYVTSVGAYNVDNPDQVQLYEERESMLYRGRSEVPGQPNLQPRFRLLHSPDSDS